MVIHRAFFDNCAECHWPHVVMQSVVGLSVVAPTRQLPDLTAVDKNLHVSEIDGATTFAPGNTSSKIIFPTALYSHVPMSI